MTFLRNSLFPLSIIIVDEKANFSHFVTILKLKKGSLDKLMYCHVSLISYLCLPTNVTAKCSFYQRLFGLRFWIFTNRWNPRIAKATANKRNASCKNRKLAKNFFMRKSYLLYVGEIDISNGIIIVLFSSVT